MRFSTFSGGEVRKSAEAQVYNSWIDLNATQTYGTAWFTLIHNIFVNNLDGQKYVLLEILDLSTSVDFDTLSSSSSELWCIYVCTG